MSSGLKNELGLGEPKPQGSSEQKDQFKAAFQSKISKVNTNLQYTSAHAEKAKHDPEAGKRDTTCSAFQMALSKIDPTNPSAAQGAIDQVLAAVDKLGSSAEAFKEKVQKAFDAWTAKEGEFDDWSDKIREMADWGHEKAEALQKVATTIVDKANEKKYEESVKGLEGLSSKADPIYEDYLKEKEAQVEYDAGLPDVESKLNKSAEGIEDEEELQQKQLKLSEMADAMKESAAGKAFTEAVEKLKALGEELLAFLEEVAEKQKQKKAYEAALAAVEADITAADGTSHEDHFVLKQASDAYKPAKADLDALVTAKDWEAATNKVTEVGGLAKKFVDLHKKYEEFTTEYAAASTDLNYVKGLVNNCPPDPTWSAELTQMSQLINDYHTGDFDAAIAGIKALKPKIADLKKRVIEKDKETEPKAEEAEKEIRDLTGGKEIDKLNDGERKALIEKLKGLKPEKRKELLRALHAPSAALTEEQKHMQAAMYMAMDMDPEFKKADKKARDAYVAELQKDEELQTAIKNWNAKDKDGNPLVDQKTKEAMLKKIVSVQSKAYGIDEPEMSFYPNPGPNADGFTVMGGFNQSTTRITLNDVILKDPERAINTVVHENTHNYQDELAKDFIAGKIKKDDPRYEQAETFAMFHHMGAYESGDIWPNPKLTGPPPHPLRGYDVYKTQPEEMHAFNAGDTESKRIANPPVKKPKKKTK